MRLSIIIPTYGREQTLLDTLEALFKLAPAADEILIVDQTPQHTPQVEKILRGWDKEGKIRLLTLSEPSIPKAMNQGLLHATHEIVLFLDDDILPDSALVQAHLAAHKKYPNTLIAGRVIQPWEEGVDFSTRRDFHFAGLYSFWIEEFMGGNFSLKRQKALQLGGFDENFVRVAYRFEAEFAHRWRSAGERIYFEPAACIHHLKVPSGGTRRFGEHLRTLKPDHAVGAYYYFLRTLPSRRIASAFLKFIWGGIATRHHLRRPWWIPITLAAHMQAIFWALLLSRRGPRYISSKNLHSGEAYG